MKKAPHPNLEQEEVCQNVRVGSIKKPPIRTVFNVKIFWFLFHHNFFAYIAFGGF